MFSSLTDDLSVDAFAEALFRVLHSKSELCFRTNWNQIWARQKAPTSAGDVSSPEFQIANSRLQLLAPVSSAGNSHSRGRPSPFAGSPHRWAETSQPKLRLQPTPAK